MSMSKLSLFKKKLGYKLSKNSPEILTAIGIGGLITAIGLAISETPKAMKLIEKEKERQSKELKKVAKKEGCDDAEPVTKLDKPTIVKVTWRCYVPTIVTTISSSACIVFASKVNRKRNAALATAYTLSETAMKEYKSRVIDTIGIDKEKEIQKEINQDKINKMKEEDVVTYSDEIRYHEDYLCCDTTFDKYFRSTKIDIKDAQNKLNRDLISDMYVSVNDLYYLLGIHSIPIGDDLGWNADDGEIIIECDDSCISPKGEPCIAMSYNIRPRYDYRKLY